MKFKKFKIKYGDEIYGTASKNIHPETINIFEENIYIFETRVPKNPCLNKVV